MLSVLAGHNFYQRPGGEDQVFATETELLEQRGHRVLRYSEDNGRIGSGNLTLACNTVWSNDSFRRLQTMIRSTAPDVAHFHNTFPLISPSAYYAVQRAGIPVVQTLHNYRLICPGATLTRNGTVCEDCLGSRSLFPAVMHKCYRESRPATATLAAMLAVHRVAGTWRSAVDVYIALSEFARRKFIAGGLRPEQIAVKPNFVSPDPGRGDGRGGYALFVGRLSQEKGVSVLARAWQALADVPLLVAGDGPLRDTAWPDGVTFLGHQRRERILELMRSAKALIFPSVWYECAPMTILEAFACGLPVIASNLGSLPEFVEHHRTGLLFRPGDAQDLAAKVRWAFDHPQELAAMRVAARREFEEKYSAERNYKMLMSIYELAIENARRRKRADAPQREPALT